MNDSPDVSVDGAGGQLHPPLDPDFIPMAPALHAYRKKASRHARAENVEIALERTDGAVSRWREPVLPQEAYDPDKTIRHIERIIKFLLWSRGGGTLYLAGPSFISRHLADRYAPGGLRAFDAQLMGRVYDRVFEVRLCSSDELPRENETSSAIGGFLDGCRLGFDLGASDFKLAAVKDGEVVYSAEIPWHPVVEVDPSYHLGRLNDGLRLAAAHLPRVDAIGGSSAGIYIDNKVMVASLFRSVPPEIFSRDVKPMFLNLQREWGVPLVVVNDGDVTALAGAMSLNRKPLLGIAMGSSEAAGYINADGHICGWLNELAFAPVDMNPRAAMDEWSGDQGVGALYFSQQAVNRLAPAAGIDFSNDMGLPDRLREVQRLATCGDSRAIRIFETIGRYLGYSLALYQEFYDFSDVLILGRVTSGNGGDIILEQARKVMGGQQGDAIQPVTIHVPDEISRRVGQAVAAASLPRIAG
jgi:predicted NBD/HSP70 family sugar kinase